MIWIARIIFVILFLLSLDVLHGLVGLAISSFPLRRHPKLHRAGLRLMAMSTLFCGHVLPRRCELCCGVDEFRNWTCPGQKAYPGKKV